MSKAQEEKEMSVVTEKAKYDYLKQAIVLFILILLVTMAFWISKSPFLSAYSWDWVILLGLLIFIGGLFTCYQHINPNYIYIVAVLVFISGLLLTWSNDSYALIGVIGLIISVIVGSVVVYMEGKKTEYEKINKLSLWVTVAGTVIVVFASGVTFVDAF